jgi:hypothetical protein
MSFPEKTNELAAGVLRQLNRIQAASSIKETNELCGNNRNHQLKLILNKHLPPGEASSSSLATSC